MHNLLQDVWGKGPKVRKRKDQGESEEKRVWKKNKTGWVCVGRLLVSVLVRPTLHLTISVYPIFLLNLISMWVPSLFWACVNARWSCWKRDHEYEGLEGLGATKLRECGLEAATGGDQMSEQLHTDWAVCDVHVKMNAVCVHMVTGKGTAFSLLVWPVAHTHAHVFVYTLPVAGPESKDPLQPHI